MLEGNKERFFYIKLLEAILKRISTVTPQFKKKKMFLVHDYDHALCSVTVNSFAGNGGIMETIHPPFSPDHFSG